MNVFQRWIMNQAVKIQQKSYTFSQLLSPGKTDRPIWNDWSGDKATKEGYKASSYVYTSINKISRAVSAVPWKVYKRNSKGEWEEQEKHPLAELMRRPNPYLNRKDFMEIMVQHLYLAGNSVITKVRGIRGVVVELWPLMPDSIKPIPGQEDFIKVYRYNYDGVVRDIEPKDIIHARFMDPSNLYWGLAPLQVIARTVDTDVEAVKWNKVSLQNRAVTDGVFAFKEPLTYEQWQEARQQVREQHQGSSNARAPWVLGGGAQWLQMSLSPAEMDFIESRKMTREEIASLFGVPLPMLGINDVTYANYGQARKAFYEDTIIPFLDDLQDEFNMAFAPEFGDDIELRYDISNIAALQENFSEKLKNAESLFRMGVPFNEINQRLELGFDELEGGDISYLPANLIPTSGSMYEEEEPTDPESEPEDDDEPNPEDEPEDDDDDEGKSKGATAAQKKKVREIAEAMKGYNLDNETKRAHFWKSNERARQPFYTAMIKDLNKLFEKQAAAAAKGYKENRMDGFTQAIDGTKKEWQETFIKHYRRTIAHFGSQVFNNLKSTAGPDYKKEDEFDPWNVIIERYITEVTALKVTYVLEFTKNHIAAIIREMRMQDGASVDQVARRVRDEIGLFSTHRSYRIARTEIMSANNYGSLEAAKQSELPLKKMWVSSRDDRVRTSHSHAGVDGEVVDLDDRFSNGLERPGDFHGPAEEVVHCRCALAYVPAR